jgi:hypothetical protein
MRTNMVALGNAVRSAVISGRREITKPMPKTPSIGQDIEEWEMNEVQIPGSLPDTFISHFEIST